MMNEVVTRPMTPTARMMYLLGLFGWIALDIQGDVSC